MNQQLEQMLEPAKCVYRVGHRIVVQTRGFLRTRNIFRNANDRQLAAYKDKHLGEKCFLIGSLHLYFGYKYFHDKELS